MVQERAVIKIAFRRKWAKANMDKIIHHIRKMTTYSE